ncbi:MAG: hypothetical protein HXX17_06255 [Geobacteraceae bacterium]|nr:hypothetical protein [Geobacteraceae bacterium]
MNATLIFKTKESSGDYIREMVVWRLDQPVPGCRHNFKYRFFYGMVDGTCLVRYDNERGKGDHKHMAGTECQYLFRNLKQLFADFLTDIEIILRERGGV